MCMLCNNQLNHCTAHTQCVITYALINLYTPLFLLIIIIIIIPPLLFILKNVMIWQRRVCINKQTFEIWCAAAVGQHIQPCCVVYIVFIQDSHTLVVWTQHIVLQCVNICWCMYVCHIQCTTQTQKIEWNSIIQHHTHTWTHDMYVC